MSRARRAVRLQFLALGWVAGVWGAHMPSIKKHYGLSEGSLSLVLLAIAVGAVLSLSLAGRVVAALGARMSAMLTAGLMGASLSLALQWPTPASLWAAMVVFGAAMSLLDVAINTEGSALEVLGGRPVMGNFHGHFSVGGMAGALGAGAMIHALWPAATQLAWSGVAVAVLGGLGARGLQNATVADTPEAQGLAAPRPLHPPRKQLWLLGLLCFAGMCAEGAMYDWGVLYLHQQVGLSQATAAWGYAAFAGAMAAARLSGDAVRKRWPEPVLLRTGGWVTALAMASVLLTGHPTVAFVGFALMGAGLAMVVPMIYNAASQVKGVPRASAIATVSVIGYTGFLVGPLVVGAVAEWAHLGWALGLVVPLAAWLAWGARHLPAAALQRRTTPA